MDELFLIRPWALALLLPLGALVWSIHRQRTRGAGAGPRWGWLSAVAAGALALSLAGPHITQPAPTTRVVLDARSQGESPGLGSTQAQGSPWSEAWRGRSPRRDPFHIHTLGTTPDLARGMEHALDEHVPGRELEVTVLGSGTTTGSALDRVRDRLFTAGARVHWLPTKGSPAPTPSIHRLDHSHTVRRRHPFTLAVELTTAPSGNTTGESTAAPEQEARGAAALDTGTWELLVVAREPGNQAGEQGAPAGAPGPWGRVVFAGVRGPQRIQVPCRAPDQEPGVAGFQVLLRRVDGTRDGDPSRASSDQLGGCLWVDRPLPIGWLGAQGTAPPLREPLLRQGIELRPVTGPGEAVDPTLPAILVADLPADAWPTGTMAAVRTAILSDGLGLVLAGTDGNGGPGGYGRSALADVLPVTFPAREERRDPSVSVVLILDTSGSMGGTRVELAKEVGRLALKGLQPHDKVGIVEFYGSKRWAAPIQSAGNQIALTRALNRLQAGGGTVIYSALEEAFYALLTAQTRYRHVVVMTDGGVESGPFEALARRMADNRINLHTVLVGPQGNSPFLLDLAKWGRGRFYSCPDRFHLPELRFKEPQTTRLPGVERRRAPVAIQGQHIALAELDDAKAEIEARIEMRPRPEAGVVWTAGGRPLTATWQPGAGRVWVHGTRLAGPAAGTLSTTAGYTKAVAGILRDAAATREGAAPQLELRPTCGALEVIALDPSLLAGTTRTLEWRTAGGRSGVWPLPVIAPGRGESVLPWEGGADQAMIVTLRDSNAPPAAALPPTDDPRRLRDQSRSLSSLVAATGGRMLQAGALPPVREAGASGAREPRPLAPWLALGALVLWLLGGLARRLPTGAVSAGIPMSSALLWLMLLCGLAAAPPVAAQSEDPYTAIHTELERVGSLARLEREWADRDWRYRAALATAQGRIPEALKVLAEVPWRPGKDPQPALLRLQLLAAEGSVDQATELLDQLIAAGAFPPGDTLRRWQLRRAQWAAAKALAADPSDLSQLRGFRQALDSDPKWNLTVAHTAAAVAANQLGSSAVDPAWFRFPAAQAAAADTVLEGKARVQNRFFEGLWWRRAGDLDAAAAAYRTAFEASDRDSLRRAALAGELSVARDQDTLNQLADRWKEQRTTLHPLRFQALLDALRELGRSTEALELARDRGGRGDAAMAREAMRMAAELGARDKAKAWARELLNDQPGDIALRCNLAVWMRDDGEGDQASALLEAGIAAATGGGLRQLADTSVELALPRAIQAAGQRFAAGPPALQLDGVLWRAQRLRKQRQTKAAVEALRGAAEAFPTPGASIRIAEMFESMGQEMEAIRLLERAQEASPTEDVALRLAWLLSRQRSAASRAESLRWFKRVWLEAGSPARRAQAEERVLDQASRQGTLADLAIQLEEELDDPNATPEAKRLKRAGLVKLYSRAGDTVAAVALLEEWAREAPDQAIAAWRRIARVHFENQEYGPLDRALDRLIGMDPPGRIDYVQQLAMSALERGRPARAQRALQRLLDDPESGAVAFEFAAGVQSLAGRFEAAVRIYRQTLARHPDRFETLLLWAAAKDALGQREEALGTFAMILQQEALRDDVLLVAVDGMLNLDADGDTLRVALRRLQRAVAERPGKVYLHRGLQDVLEALGQPAARRLAVEATLAIAGEQRPAWLREAMEDAKSQGDNAGYLRLGRDLLAGGHGMPPAVFVDLGEAMLREGDLEGAERAFSRARFANDFRGIEERIAKLYADAGRLEDALRVRRRLLRRDPAAPRPRLDVARLLEQKGDLVAACRAYTGALLAHLEQGPDLGERAGSRRRGRNKDTSKLEPEPMLAAALRTAGSPQLLEPLRSALLGRLDAAGPSADRLRLLLWLRRVLDGQGDLKALAATTAQLIAIAEAEPKRDPQILDILTDLQARGQWAAAARVLDAAEPLDPDGPEDGEERPAKFSKRRWKLAVASGDLEAAREQATRAPSAMWSNVVQGLVLLGDRGTAEDLVDQWQGNASTSLRSMQRYGDAAQLLGRPADQRAIRERQLKDALARSPGSTRASKVLDALENLGETLPQAERAATLRQLLPDLKDAKERLLVEFLEAARGILDDGELIPLLHLAIDAKRTRFHRLKECAQLSAMLNPEEAARRMRRALDGLDQQGQVRVAIQMVRLEPPPPEAVLAMALERIDPGRLDPAERNRLARICATEPADTGGMAQLAARLTQVAPSDLCSMVLAARRATDPATRQTLCRRILAALGRASDADTSVRLMLPGIAKALDAKGRQDALAGKANGMTMLRLRAELHELDGDLTAAAEALTAAHALKREDAGLALAVARAWRAAGEPLRALPAMGMWMERAPKLYSYQAQQYAQLLLEAGQPEQALAALQRVDGGNGSANGLALKAIAGLEDPAQQARALTAWGQQFGERMTGNGTSGGAVRLTRGSSILARLTALTPFAPDDPETGASAAFAPLPAPSETAATDEVIASLAILPGGAALASRLLASLSPSQRMASSTLYQVAVLESATEPMRSAVVEAAVPLWRGGVCTSEGLMRLGAAAAMGWTVPHEAFLAGVRMRWALEQERMEALDLLEVGRLALALSDLAELPLDDRREYRRFGQRALGLMSANREPFGDYFMVRRMPEWMGALVRSRPGSLLDLLPGSSSKVGFRPEPDGCLLTAILLAPEHPRLEVLPPSPEQGDDPPPGGSPEPGLWSNEAWLRIATAYGSFWSDAEEGPRPIRSVDFPLALLGLWLRHPDQLPRDLEWEQWAAKWRQGWSGSARKPTLRMPQSLAAAIPPLESWHPEAPKPEWLGQQLLQLAKAPGLGKNASGIVLRLAALVAKRMAEGGVGPASDMLRRDLAALGRDDLTPWLRL